MEGVERELAVLFADVLGSAKLYEKLGGAEAARALDRCIKRMERAIEGFHGRLVRTVRDEIFVVFESAEDAFQSAMEMQERVSDLPPVSGVKMEIRIGVHFGPVLDSQKNVTGETVTAAARIVGAAGAGQILASTRATDELPSTLRDLIRELSLSAGGIQLSEIVWQKPGASKSDEPSSGLEADSATAREAAPAIKLCVRYREKAYLLDEDTPFLTLGRESGSDLVIVDRKASRHHGRIERRGNTYFYVDVSSNGSYVTLPDAPEVLVRHADIALEGAGTICFGSSGNDPQADCARFEHL